MSPKVNVLETQSSKLSVNGARWYRPRLSMGDPEGWVWVWGGPQDLAAFLI